MKPTGWCSASPCASNDRAAARSGSVPDHRSRSPWNRVSWPVRRIFPSSRGCAGSVGGGLMLYAGYALVPPSLAALLVLDSGQ